jgi:glutamine amidotransferase
MKVVVIDLELGNIQSLSAALSYLGVECEISSNAESIALASHLILPGVGAFDHAMEKVNSLLLYDSIYEHAVINKKPILGICLGMQLLTSGSDEGSLKGLSLIDGYCVKMKAKPISGFKVPHVGFSSISGYKPKGLFSHLNETADFYFTHSFALPELPNNFNIAICNHLNSFVAAFQIDNLCGAQFHPEKSQSTGLRLISNFLELS